ncbi:hypothetical protein Cylst_5201 [Cylindrospermum stagnale PCC 7417]|uniref:Uncharacterized protein n=1 Tax=Cylindrospermum stagnale PCC 7417 TaxID=56107 RepID=K9X6H2_9NOST|nr:hypothetical protein [Cylindrospermum stagnale]AFZ27237.1 hypothetical protein Cylst_5201 [Cylindrospermum stagnale PCC 7417]
MTNLKKLANYADPNWDYSSVYGIILSSGFDDLIKEMASVEDATPESDAQLVKKLDFVIAQLQSARITLGKELI